MGYITVRIGRLPGRIEEFCLNGDRTVAAALSTAGLSTEGYEIRVDGRPASVATTLEDGSVILLTKPIVGN